MKNRLSPGACQGQKLQNSKMMKTRLVKKIGTQTLVTRRGAAEFRLMTGLAGKRGAEGAGEIWIRWLFEFCSLGELDGRECVCLALAGQNAWAREPTLRCAAVNG